MCSSDLSRGISTYPVLGAAAYAATERDLARIYAKPDTPTLQIGVLHQDPGKIAHLRAQDFLSKHSAIVGTVGSGKSCALTLILRALLDAHPNGHVVLLDPHDEYAHAFQGMAEIITPQNLQLPYWLLSFEEIVEVLCSRDPVSRSSGHGFGHIHTKNAAVRPNAAGQFQDRRAAAAADIHHAFPRCRRSSVQGEGGQRDEHCIKAVLQRGPGDGRPIVPVGDLGGVVLRGCVGHGLLLRRGAGRCAFVALLATCSPVPSGKGCAMIGR